MLGTNENIGNKPKAANSVIDSIIAIYTGSFMSRWGKKNRYDGRDVNGSLLGTNEDWLHLCSTRTYLGRRYGKENMKVFYMGMVVDSETLKVVNLI